MIRRALELLEGRAKWQAMTRNEKNKKSNATDKIDISF